jgi:hypothetical protein
MKAMGSRSDFDFEIDVPCLDITIDPNDAENGAKEVLALITDRNIESVVCFGSCQIFC